MDARCAQVVRKRDGRIVDFDPSRIARAVAAAFHTELNLGANGLLDRQTEQRVDQITARVAEQIAAAARCPEGVAVERIQDVVETQLMRDGHYSVARRYIVYREEHRRSRLLSGRGEVAPQVELFVRNAAGQRRPLQPSRIRGRLERASRTVRAWIDLDELADDVFSSLYDGISTGEIQRALILAARSRAERHPAYGQLAARLLLETVYEEVWGPQSLEALNETYRDKFSRYLDAGINADRLEPALREFEIDLLAEAIRPDRDAQFGYMGLQTLYDRYLIQTNGRRIEAPQYLWMRVAMGLALRETQSAQRAIEFYEVLSTFRFCCSTPTLFNSGTRHPQLSSCYLLTVQDDLHDIFDTIGDNAKLSKWAGGLGNDWTPVRATGSLIKGTGGKSQGVVPFLKIVNDTAVAVNQGGKRKGAVCAYLETWHLDIEEFLELRKNTGDERRRTHDMHTANWIPNLFIKRVLENGLWTLFSPDETADLHDLYGPDFDARYEHYELLAQQGKLRQSKRVEAVALWRKMLSMLYETGHPWLTFKDPSNLRSPQEHAGVVHCSNLCTEILLNTGGDETAVCNLGSINLAEHVIDGELDRARLRATVTTAVRMLDNVIDVNFYPTAKAANANQRHRPIGLGLMGFQDALYRLGLSFSDPIAVEFADRSMELISYHAILASAELARERGPYESYPGSKWSRGLLPIDTLGQMVDAYYGRLDVDRSTSLDWDIVRSAVQRNGMRNSNVLAIAPTATIANIAGCSASIEPTYRNLYAKSNLSGDFTVLNPYLVEDLLGRGLWDQEMVDAMKYYDGSVQEIERIPGDVKKRFPTAFEIDPRVLVECAARRQKWIDMGQSLNLYISNPSGKLLSELYLLAWSRGLKTTYYLRSQAPTQIEKSSLDINRWAIQPRWMKSRSASQEIRVERFAAPTCDPSDLTCEACQ